jgi:hypothetical protein
LKKNDPPNQIEKKKGAAIQTFSKWIVLLYPIRNVFVIGGKRRSSCVMESRSTVRYRLSHSAVIGFRIQGGKRNMDRLHSLVSRLYSFSQVSGTGLFVELASEIRGKKEKEDRNFSHPTQSNRSITEEREI